MLGKPVVTPFRYAWGPSVLSSMLNAGDKKKNERRLDAEYTHVSSMVGWCAREEALLHMKDEVPQERVNGEHYVMWAIGKAAERHVRETLLAQIGVANAFGVWACKCEKTQRTGFGDATKKCVTCNTTVTQYNEFQAVSNKWRVRGSIDFLMRKPNGKIAVVEIKSITNSASANAQKKGFETLAKPMGDHIFQATCYVNLLGDPDVCAGHRLEVDDTAIILYVCKDFKWGLRPYKEFHHTYGPTDEARTLTEFRSAKQVWLAGKGKPLPPRTMCAHIGCSTAVKCPVALECFRAK